MTRKPIPDDQHWVPGTYSGLLGIVAILLTACSGVSIQGTDTYSSDPTQNEYVQEVTSTSTIQLPSATWTPVPPTITSSPLPTNTPTWTPSPVPSHTPTETSPPYTPSGEDAIYVYLILPDSDGPIACGDTLVPVNTGVLRSGDIAQDVRTALSKLFVKRQFIAGLYNPAYLSNITITDVAYKPYGGQISIQLSGTYVRSGDRCDDRRVREQVWTTIRQFKEVKVIDILLNGNLLGDILATGK